MTSAISHRRFYRGISGGGRNPRWNQLSPVPIENGRWNGRNDGGCGDVTTAKNGVADDGAGDEVRCILRTPVCDVVGVTVTTRRCAKDRRNLREKRRSTGRVSYSDTATGRVTFCHWILGSDWPIMCQSWGVAPSSVGHTTQANSSSCPLWDGKWVLSTGQSSVILWMQLGIKGRTSVFSRRTFPVLRSTQPVADGWPFMWVNRPL